NRVSAVSTRKHEPVTSRAAPRKLSFIRIHSGLRNERMSGPDAVRMSEGYTGRNMADMRGAGFRGSIQGSRHAACCCGRRPVAGLPSNFDGDRHEPQQTLAGPDPDRFDLNTCGVHFAATLAL